MFSRNWLVSVRIKSTFVQRHFNLLLYHLSYTVQWMYVCVGMDGNSDTKFCMILRIKPESIYILCVEKKNTTEYSRERAKARKCVSGIDRIFFYNTYTHSERDRENVCVCVLYATHFIIWHLT